MDIVILDRWVRKPFLLPPMVAVACGCVARKQRLLLISVSELRMNEMYLAERLRLNFRDILGALIISLWKPPQCLPELVSKVQFWAVYRLVLGHSGIGLGTYSVLVGELVMTGLLSFKSEDV